MLTKFILIEKDLRDLILIGPCSPYQNPGLWTKEMKEDHIAIGIAKCIITEGVSNKIAVKIIDHDNTKDM